MKDYRRIRQRVAAGECDSRWRRSIGLAARSLSRADHDGWDELTGAVQRPGLSCPVGTPIEVDRGRPPRGGRRGHVRDDGGSPGPDIRLGPHRATMRTMRIQRFRALVAAGPRGRAVIVVPFDPDAVWGAKAEHPVGGTIDGRRVRGTIAPSGSRWAFTVSPMWLRDASVAAGDDVIVELAPEGPQRAGLAEDIAAALAANPAAAAFFDTLAQFYRKAYLRWIDATTRRPDLRAARIAEVVDLLAAGIKQRPRS